MADPNVARDIAGGRGRPRGKAIAKPVGKRSVAPGQRKKAAGAKSAKAYAPGRSRSLPKPPGKTAPQPGYRFGPGPNDVTGPINPGTVPPGVNHLPGRNVIPRPSPTTRFRPQLQGNGAGPPGPPRPSVPPTPGSNVARLQGNGAGRPKPASAGASAPGTPSTPSFMRGLGPPTKLPGRRVVSRSSR